MPTFFLIAWHALLSLWNESGDKRIRFGSVMILALLLGLLCFSRGVIVSCIAGVSIFIPVILKQQRINRFNLLLSVGCILPAVLVAALIFSNSTGNHHQLAESPGSTAYKMLEFALHCFLRNPWQRLFGVDGAEYWQLLIWGIPKVIIIICAFLFVGKFNWQVRALLIGMLLFEVASSLLVGVGRYHTGLIFADGSRYQYEYLIALSPALAVIVAFIQANIRKSLYFVSCLAVCGWLWLVSSSWDSAMQEWSNWRGRDGRKVLLRMDSAPPGVSGTQLWLGIPPILSFDEAKATVKEFNLH